MEKTRGHWLGRWIEPKAKVEEGRKLFSDRDLKALILPLFVEQALAMLVGVADTLMVSYAGEAAVSGVSLVNMVNTLFIYLFTALASGGAVVVSQYLGRGDKKEGDGASCQLYAVTFLFSLGVAALMLLFHRQLLGLLFRQTEPVVMEAGVTYLRILALSYPALALYNAGAALYRSMGRTKTTMKVSLCMNVINTGGNAIGIFVLRAGVAGVACGAGVSTLYLCPIFESDSNHRYNTGDYDKIDPMLGTEEDFTRLCTKAHALGIHVMLDGVFNHTGNNSRYFNALGSYPSLGAAQSKESPYYPWYNFQEWPHRYDCWWGIHTLPAVNESHPEYIDFIIEGKDAVIRRWLRAGADAWRLDVADELPDEFIARIRRVMMEEKAESFLLGEVWEDGSNKIAYSKRRKYLLGRETHGLMN